MLIPAITEIEYVSEVDYSPSIYTTLQIGLTLTQDHSRVDLHNYDHIYDRICFESDSN
jgi:hypothetical protein